MLPEAAVGGPIAVVRDGDEIFMDAKRGAIELCISSEELAERLARWLPPHPPNPLNGPPNGRGVLARYGRHAALASQGASLD
ncbi:MAG: dihydroxy-acid dehydratase [Gemmatimonadetes bacterium]|nr:dihydroxy-acid dehydratase [Gemmatimonadota bacterium]